MVDRIILVAMLAAAFLVPATSILAQEGKSAGEYKFTITRGVVDMVFYDYKQNIREWVRDESPDKPSYDEKFEEIKRKYDIPLRMFIEVIRLSSDTPELTEGQIEGMMDYLFNEDRKMETLEYIREKSVRTESWGCNPKDTDGRLVTMECSPKAGVSARDKNATGGRPAGLYG